LKKKAIELLNERFKKLNNLVEDFQDTIVESVRKTFEFEEEDN